LSIILADLYYHHVLREKEESEDGGIIS